MVDTTEKIEPPSALQKPVAIVLLKFLVKWISVKKGDCSNRNLQHL